MGYCYGPRSVSYTGTAIVLLGSATVGGGPATAGDVLSVSHDSWTWSGPPGGTGYVYFYNWTNPAASDTEFLASPSTPHHYDYTCPNDGLYTVTVFTLPASGYIVDFVNLALTAPFCTGSSPSGFCAYGVQANPDATYYELITDALIDIVVATALAGTANAYLIPYVETALAALEGSIFVGVDCSTMPGAGPTLDFPNLSTLSTATLQAWFQNAAWRFFCKCIPAPPGSADPIPPDPPPIIPPTLVVPVQPTPVCDNMDLCTYLAAMKAQLQAITAQISYLRTDVRLIQRQHVPFAYVPGALHSGLTGAGQFAVQGILGLAVQVTTVPGVSGEEIGDPVAHFGLGWVTTGTPDGWRRSVAIRHNPQWVDVAPDDTLIGYSLEPLVVANIEEFAREP